MSTFPQVFSKFLRKADMLSERSYFAWAGIRHYIYAIGGKSMDGATSKSIEYYSVLENKWRKTKVQLNYARVFGSAICINNQWIYIVGGTTQTEWVEWFNISEQDTLGKCEKLVFEHNFYTPYFHELCIHVKDFQLSQVLYFIIL